MQSVHVDLTVNRRPVLGTFGKAVEDAVSINFGISGGPNCDKGCRHHPRSTHANPTRSCYSIRIEKRYDRKELRKKLARHQAADPAHIAELAMQEIRSRIGRKQPVPWARFSSAGSLPQPRQATKTFLAALRNLLTLCNEHNIPVHLPVETARKAMFYRRHIGDLVTVRESAQTQRRFLTAVDAVSTVAGTAEMNRAERVRASKELARMRTMLGRKAIVCPAVADWYLHGKPGGKAKCGNCTACARSDLDVIYPLH